MNYNTCSTISQYRYYHHPNFLVVRSIEQLFSRYSPEYSCWANSSFHVIRPNILVGRIALHVIRLNICVRIAIFA